MIEFAQLIASFSLEEFLLCYVVLLMPCMISLVVLGNL